MEIENIGYIDQKIHVMTRLLIPELATATNVFFAGDQHTDRQSLFSGVAWVVQLIPSGLVMIRLP